MFRDPAICLNLYDAPGPNEALAGAGPLVKAQAKGIINLCDVVMVVINFTTKDNESEVEILR